MPSGADGAGDLASANNLSDVGSAATSFGNIKQNATTSATGVASFSSDNFAVSSGAVTIKDGGVVTAEIADDAVTYAKMQHTGTANRVLGAASAGVISEVQVVQAMLGDQAVNEAKLQVSNGPTNGYFLSAQSANTGGLTWAEVSAGGGTTTTYAKFNGNNTVAVQSSLNTASVRDDGTGQYMHFIDDDYAAATYGSTGNVSHDANNGYWGVHFQNSDYAVGSRGLWTHGGDFAHVTVTHLGDL